jgi:quercetin dioxygenase-like cupin family protein
MDCIIATHCHEIAIWATLPVAANLVLMQTDGTAEQRSMNETTRVQHFRSMEGKTYQLGPLRLAFKRHEGEGEGPYSVFESLEPPGARVALHRHPSFQETFVVLEGCFDFDVAGERRALGPGEMLVIPRGAAHGFACTSPQPGRLLTISTPSRLFEAFVADISAADRGGTEADVRAVFARHGVELL